MLTVFEGQSRRKSTTSKRWWMKRVQNTEKESVFRNTEDRAEASRRNQTETSGNSVATLMEKHASPERSRNHRAAGINLKRQHGIWEGMQMGDCVEPWSWKGMSKS